MLSAALFSSKTGIWTTPDSVYKPLHAEFQFTLDAAASEDNAKCAMYYDQALDGLQQSWLCNHRAKVKGSEVVPTFKTLPVSTNLRSLVQDVDPTPCTCGVIGPGAVWCNPPYSRFGMHLWMKRAYETAQAGRTVVMLLPARTSNKWFHDWVVGKAEVRFIKGRLRFSGSKNTAPFPSMIAVYRAPVW